MAWYPTPWLPCPRAHLLWLCIHEPRTRKVCCIFNEFVDHCTSAELSVLSRAILQCPCDPKNTPEGPQDRHCYFSLTYGAVRTSMWIAWPRDTQLVSNHGRSAPASPYLSLEFGVCFYPHVHPHTHERRLIKESWKATLHSPAGRNDSFASDVFNCRDSPRACQGTSRVLASWLKTYREERDGHTQASPSHEEERSQWHNHTHTHTHNCSWDRWSWVTQASPVQVWREVSPGKSYVSRSLMAGEWVARKREMSKVGQRKECPRQEGRVQKPSWQEKTWGPRSIKGFPGGSVIKNLPANVGDAGHAGSIPQLGRSPGGGSGNPAFLPGESHRQKSLVGYSPWGWKDSNTTEHAWTRGPKEYPAGPQERTREQWRHVAGWAGQGHQARCWRQWPQFDLYFKTSWVSGKVSNKYDGLIMWIWGASCYLLCGIDAEETSEKRLMPASGWKCSLERLGRLEKSTKNPDSKLAVPSQEPPPSVQHRTRLAFRGAVPPAALHICGDLRQLTHSGGDWWLWEEADVPDGDGQFNLQLLNLFRYSVLPLKIHLDLS